MRVVESGRRWVVVDGVKDTKEDHSPSNLRTDVRQEDLASGPESYSIGLRRHCYTESRSSVNWGTLLSGERG